MLSGGIAQLRVANALFALVLGGCGSEVVAPGAADASPAGGQSGTSSAAAGGGFGGGSSSASSGAGGGLPGHTCPARDGDPFAGGKAVVAHSHSSTLTFDMLANDDPNIWDLTYMNGVLHAVVVAANANEVARVDPDGTVTGLFVTDVEVAPVLSSDADHFVLESGSEPGLRYTTLAGVTEAIYEAPTANGGWFSEGIGRVIYTLGIVDDDDDGDLGVYFVDLDTHATGRAFSVAGEPLPFLATAGNTLLLASPQTEHGDCLYLRAYQLDGTLLQDLCIQHPFIEVNGMAFDHGCLAVADRSAGKMHYFEVSESP